MRTSEAFRKPSDVGASHCYPVSDSFGVKHTRRVTVKEIIRNEL